MKSALKNILAATAIIVFLGLAGMAQKGAAWDQPDFSGTWILDEERSFTDSSDRKDYDDYTLEITQNGAEFNIKKSYVYQDKPISFEINLFTDKRKETNRVPTASGDEIEIKSETFWKKNLVVREFLKDPLVPPFGQIGIYQTDKYTLSKDGKTLYFYSAPLLPSDGMITFWPSLNSNLIFRKK